MYNYGFLTTFTLITRTYVTVLVLPSVNFFEILFNNERHLKRLFIIIKTTLFTKHVQLKYLYRSLRKQRPLFRYSVQTVVDILC